MPDQEVHEIQLNGKQLVFMFMAATVVSVVIFLCGVMVGRGARQPLGDVLTTSSDTVIDPTATLEAASRPAVPADAAPAPVHENLTYAEHLEAPVPPDEPLKPAKPPVVLTVAPAAAEKAAAPKQASSRPEPSKAVTAQQTKEAVRQPPPAQKALAAKPEPVTERASFTEPAGKDWAVQVMAFPARAEAEALARRLTSKGFQTFVTLNEGAPRARYRVRVGKYPTKREADAVALRLQREERFEPWVTR
jgi:cell division septation protein DedD